MKEILFISVLVFIACGFAFVIIINQVKVKLKTITTIFNFNIENKTFKIINNDKPRLSFTHYNQKEISHYSKSFNPISDFNAFFADDKIMMKIRRCFLELENENINKSSFKYSPGSSNINYRLHFEFNMVNKKEGVGYFIWRKKNNKTYVNVVNNDFSSILDKTKYVQFTKIYAFQLQKESIDDRLMSISEEIHRKIKCPLLFSKQQGILYCVLYSKKKRSIIKAGKILANLFGGSKKWRYIEQDVYVAYTTLNIGVLSMLKIEEHKMHLNYILHRLVIKKKRDVLISSFDDIYSERSFVEFKGWYRILYSIVKSGDVKVVVNKIYNTLTRRSSGNFLFPYISNLFKNTNKLYTSEIKREFTDMLSIKIAMNPVTSFPRGSIVELTGSWLLKNYNKIRNPNYLYCISILSIDMLSQFSEILEFLEKEKNIKYGLKISNNLKINSLLFKKLNLSFVVIAEDISSAANRRREFSKILLINKLFEGNRAKIIYLNPALNLDDVQRKKLDIKYIVTAPSL